MLIFCGAMVLVGIHHDAQFRESFAHRLSGLEIVPVVGPVETQLDCLESQ